jgi:transglutaminase-like putative cysteine protease
MERRMSSLGGPSRLAGMSRLGGLGALGERLAHLPRDTRDTLFQLAVISWTVAPHLLHLPWWCGLLTLSVLAWRGVLALRGGALPSRWLVAGLLLLAAGLTWTQERTLLGKEAGITMLVVLVSLKTLELRARRDALVVFFLGFFLVLTHFLYSQALLTGLWLLGAVWGLLTALTLAHMPVGRPSLARAGAVAAKAAALGVPVMVVLFLLFPRIGPLWGLPQDAAGRTGLSGSLRLGGVASIAEDDSIALRVRFEGAAPPQSQLYFRGPVLSTFDGREWTRLAPTFPAAQRPRLELQVAGPPLRYEMTIEPSQLPLLPLLEMTPDVPGDAPVIPGWLVVQRVDGQWQTDRPLIERRRITATAYLQHRHGPREDVLGLRDLVDLPPNTNPRTLQWAAQLRAQPGMETADGLVLAQAVLAHIRSAGFTYTLEPGPYADNAIDEFWFERKLGFCEHFASAFVVIMRAMDVPARIVTGYQGADDALQDGYLIVRNSNAHAWAEIWVPQRGWVRIDPTAAVAPERVRRSQRLAPPPGLVAGAVNSLNPALAQQLRAAWENVNNRWNQWVLNYSRGQQFDLLRSLGVGSPDWTDLASVLIALLCGGALAGAAWAWWDRHRQDPWQRLQHRVQAQLAALGVAVELHHGPRERARRVRLTLGPRGHALAAALEALDQARYGDAAASSASALRTWSAGFARAAKATPATRH